MNANALIDAMRIPWLRKAESWKEADNYVVPRGGHLAELIPYLPEYPAEPYPLMSFTAPRPRYFIAVRPGGNRYLVNTEGYDYARYVAAMPEGDGSH